MKIRSAEFVLSAAKPNQYPKTDQPEVAFVGRSNVGKSSLMNRLINRKNLVKTSATPGKTQLINFFNINDTWMFVDLPGYGYAKVPDRVKKTWGPMVEQYLANRSQLKGVVFLLDVRRKPNSDDIRTVQWLNQYEIEPIGVITKADKLSKNQQEKQKAEIKKLLRPYLKSELILFSAPTGLGKIQLWNEIKRLTYSGSVTADMES